MTTYKLQGTDSPVSLYFDILTLSWYLVWPFVHSQLHVLHGIQYDLSFRPVNKTQIAPQSNIQGEEKMILVIEITTKVFRQIQYNKRIIIYQVHT